MKIWGRSLRTGIAAWLAGVAVLTVPLLAAAGTGVFEPHPTTPSFGTGNSIGVLLGDLDGDGDMDAVVANSGTNEGDEANTVWLNDGVGNFGPHPTTPGFAIEPHFKAALGDLDGDADLDVVAADVEGERATVWLNDGAGNFSAHPTAPHFVTGPNFGVTLGDLDGDGDLDVITPLASDQPEMVWLNDGDGSFSAHPTTPSFGAGDSFAATLGDVDGDGDLDAVVANRAAQAETVWLNDGAGNFSAHPE
ncbi:MAG TPA: FG-GAP-like repeat-containing protein, partial [Ardenticatenaceae bacterium]